MSTAKVELDFFAMENQASNSHRHRQRSLKDIQSAISKIDREILKSVIASSSSAAIRSGLSSESHQPSLPVYSPTSRMSPEDGGDKYPLTIFYNETVAVFHVSRCEAKSILTLAENGSNRDEVEKGKSTAEIPSNQHQQLVDVDAQDDDLPLARKRSLQRFLEKRKER